MMLAMVFVAGVANAATEYEIDQILILGECQFFNDAKNLKP